MTSNKLKIINDPVYGFINIPLEELYDLIQSPYVQRLRRIKQLGLSNLVYPGAEHTRFSHSVGAMYLTSQALQVLRNKGERIEEREYCAVLEAVLLHDIGHATFSHCLENFFFSCSHEELSLKFMSELGTDPMVREIFEDKYCKGFLHELISSQVDTDRLDYLTRDSFFTGVSEGVIGTERIINMFSVHNDELVIDEKGIYSIEKFIISRRLMYWQVYMHKTVVAADCLLRNILKRARFLAQDGRLYPERYPVVRHLLYFLDNGVADISDERALKYYTLTDDTDIWSSVKVWAEHEDKILSLMAKSLINRNIGHLTISEKPFDENLLQEKKKELCAQYGGRFSMEEIEQYFCCSNELHNRAYSFNDRQIKIVYKDGSVKDIYDASDQLDKEFLSKYIRKYYYYALS